MSYADDIDSELLKLHNENIIFKTELKPDIYYIILDEYGGKTLYLIILILIIMSFWNF